MGHVRRELAADPLGVRPVGDVEGEQHAPQHAAARLDAAHVEPVLAPSPRDARLAAPAGHGLAERAPYLVGAVDRGEAPPHARVVDAEQGFGRPVHREDREGVVEQDEPLPHAAGDLVELVGPPLELAHLGLDARMLLVEAPEQGRELVVHVVLERAVEVEGGQRRGDVLREALGEEDRRDDGGREDREERAREAHGDGPERRLVGRDAQDGTVGEAHGEVDRLLEQGRRVAHRGTLARLEGLAHLLAVGVAFHPRGVDERVAQDRAVRRDPREAAVAAVGTARGGARPLARLLVAAEEVGAVDPHGDGGEMQLLFEPVLLDGAEIAVQQRQDDGGRHEEHRHRGEHDRTQDRAFHRAVAVPRHRQRPFREASKRYPTLRTVSTISP